MAGPVNDSSDSVITRSGGKAKSAPERKRSTTSTASKPVRKKTAGKKAPAKRAASTRRRTSIPPSPLVDQPEQVSAAQRERMIAEAAYFKAERRGFQGGDPAQDWIEAEAEVDARLIGVRIRGK
jgi:hypothetical protein